MIDSAKRYAPTRGIPLLLGSSRFLSCGLIDRFMLLRTLRDKAVLIRTNVQNVHLL